MPPVARRPSNGMYWTPRRLPQECQQLRLVCLALHQPQVRAADCCLVRGISMQH